MLITYEEIGEYGFDAAPPGMEPDANPSFERDEPIEDILYSIGFDRQQIKKMIRDRP